MLNSESGKINASEPKAPRRLWRRKLLVLFFIFVAFGIAGRELYRGLYKYWYPFGMSHCCSKCLYISLLEYAQDHGGKYPSGEATPEASLSLLYPKYADANSLRGKTVPLEVVENLLKQGKRLTPETCGWHYVQGLDLKDNYNLAILWDKVGLDHNGGRLKNGGHEVLFLHGACQYIPASEWEDFLKQQKDFLADRKKQ